MNKKLSKENLVKLCFYSVILLTIVVLGIVYSKNIGQSLAENFGTKENLPGILQGLGNTLLITFVAFLIGVVLGIVVCFVEQSESQNTIIIIAKQTCKVYVSLFRGTPAVVQLLIIYYIVFKTVSLDYSIWIAICAFGLNSGAYVSEIVRGGINSVPKGQTIAGRSLGLSYGTVMKKIVIPQAIKNTLPSLGNEFITLIKETSIVGFIGAFDLTLAFRKLANATYDYATVYIAMGICYFVLIFAITKLFERLERRLLKNAK